MIDVLFTIISLMILCIFVHGYILRERTHKNYPRYCNTIYIPEKESLDSDKILLRQKNDIDRNFDRPVKGISEVNETISLNRLFKDIKKEGTNELIVYPEMSSRTDPYY